MQSITFKSSQDHKSFYGVLRNWWLHVELCCSIRQLFLCYTYWMMCWLTHTFNLSTLWVSGQLELQSKTLSQKKQNKNKPRNKKAFYLSWERSIYGGQGVSLQEQVLPFHYVGLRDRTLRSLGLVASTLKSGISCWPNAIFFNQIYNYKYENLF